MKTKHANLPVWMEVRLVLAPEDYRVLRNQARRQSQSAAEFVKQIVDRYLKSNQ